MSTKNLTEKELMQQAVGRRGFLNFMGKGAVAGAAIAATQVIGCGEDDDTVIPAEEIQWDEETDIVIMGAGGAGLTAAIVAREADADVIVLEKAEAVGGTTAVSGGVLQASSTEQQRTLAMVMGDTPAKHAEYWYKASEKVADQERLQWLASEAPKSIQFLVDHGLEIETVYGVSHMPMVEDSLMVSRIHTMVPSETAASGARLVEALKAAADELNSEIRLQSTVEKLIMTRDGVVAGVRVTTDGEQKHIRARKGVILASGGFDHNKEMAKAYSPQQLWELETGVCYCAPTNTGDGIRLGMAAGGDLASGMSATVGYPGAVMGTTDEVNGLWVNMYGQRFVAEDSHYAYAMRRIFQQQDSIAHAIFDEATAELGGATLGGLFGRWSADLAVEIGNGTLIKADTLEALADAIGAHAVQLQATVAQWNQDMMNGGEDTMFQRRVSLRAMGDGPYYAFRITSVNLGSAGGLRINENAQVLNDKGEAIPGLYGAGWVTGGIVGTFYPGSGTAIATAIATGRAAGAHAAAQQDAMVAG